jgi:hypothetical protein
MTAKAPHCITNANPTDTVSEATTTTDVQIGSMPRLNARRVPIQNELKQATFALPGQRTMQFLTRRPDSFFLHCVEIT